MEKSSLEPLSGADAAWLRLDSDENPLIINVMATIDPLPFEELRALIESRLLVFPRFLKKPVKLSGMYVWEKDSAFSIDHHVHVAELPAPGNKQALEQFMGDSMSQPLDRSHPLWQFILIKNFQNNQNVVVLRFHHCYVDGLALGAVFDSITDRKANVIELSSESKETTLARIKASQILHKGMETLALAMERCTHLSYRIKEESKALLSDRVYAKNSVKNGITGAAELTKLATLPTDKAGPLSGKPGLQKSCSWSKPVPIEKFKAVALHFECTTNDVLLAAVGGGLRSYLAGQVESLDDLRIHATLPVNLRPLETREGRKKLHELGNQFGTVFVPMAAQIANPVERLYKVKHDMKALKDSNQPSLSYKMMSAIGLVPTGLKEKVLELYCNKTSMVLSNVPGPRKTRYFSGSKINELMFWVPQAGQVGLGVSLLSYNGGFEIGIISDNKMIPQPSALVDHIMASLEEYAALIKQEDTSKKHEIASA